MVSFPKNSKTDMIAKNEDNFVTKSTHFVIKTADTKSDELVCDHWVEMWKTCCDIEQLPLLPNYKEKTLDFISRARESLEYQTFIAEATDGTIVGSVSCQVWAGPQPSGIKEQVSKIGTMWAVFVHPKFRRNGIASALVQKCIDYWRSIGCTQAVLLYASEDGMRVYRRLGFAPGSMLAYDMPGDAIENKVETEIKMGSIKFEMLEKCQDSDILVTDHFQRLLTTSGFQPDNLREDFTENTLAFIKNAREKLDFATFVARDSSGEVLASVCCQAWEGPFPFVLDEEYLKLGSLWGLYIRRDLNETEIACGLVQKCMSHLKSVGCKKVITLCPNEHIREVMATKCQFKTSNTMTINFIKKEEQVQKNKTSEVLPDGITKDMIQELKNEMTGSSSISDRHLGWLLKSNHNQLRMLDLDDNTKNTIQHIQGKNNMWVDPEKNWFTQNITKLGKGFDLAKLSSDPHLLAAKFDKLAPKYEEWTLGNRSKVEDWIVKVGKTHMEQLPAGRIGSVYDICCGTGLMGQMLRLCGFEGVLEGYDISQKMLNVAESRKCYNYLGIANANEKLPISDDVADAVLCTGAMELLQVDNTLVEFARVLKKGGNLWVSFQQAVSSSPTAHQNVHGVSEESMMMKLSQAGLEIIEIEKCSDAFHTPSPSMDGELLPVPYFFVVCRKV